MRMGGGRESIVKDLDIWIMGEDSSCKIQVQYCTNSHHQFMFTALTDSQLTMMKATTRVARPVENEGGDGLTERM